MFSYCSSGRLNLDSKLKDQEKFHTEKAKEYGELNTTIKSFLDKRLKSFSINWKSYWERSASPGHQCII